MTTQKQMLAEIRACGLTARVCDGEVRINYPESTEETAYYTTSRSDAIATARKMQAGRAAYLYRRRLIALRAGRIPDDDTVCVDACGGFAGAIEHYETLLRDIEA